MQGGATTAVRSPGCGLTPPAAPGTAQRMPLWVPDASRTSSGWRCRHFWLNTPSAYRPERPSMLVLAFHGFYDVRRALCVRERAVHACDTGATRAISRLPSAECAA